MYRIVNKEVLAPDISLIEIKAPWWLERRRPVSSSSFAYGRAANGFPSQLQTLTGREGPLPASFRRWGNHQTTGDFGSRRQAQGFRRTVGTTLPIQNFGSVVCIGGGVGALPGLSHCPPSRMPATK